MRSGQIDIEAEESFAYRSYVLVVLIFVYCLSYLDRHLLSILANDIKKDLNISDGSLGFLYGTAFSVTFAIMGISLARIADTGSRKKLIAGAILFWSLLTSLSGVASTFLQLAACRFGVAVGESGAAPASYSLVCDYFSEKVRGMALAVLASGLYIGAGLGLVLGGAILNGWHLAFPSPDSAPFGLKGWQAAFLIMGAPGLLLAFLAYNLREPRPKGAEQARSPGKHSLAQSLSVLAAMIPVVNYRHLAQPGFRLQAALANCALATAIAAVVVVLVGLTGDYVQWITLGVGFYAILSWIHALRSKDPEQFQDLFGSKSLIFLILGYAVTVLVGGGILFWSVPFYQRVHESNVGNAGLELGVTTVLGGLVGLLCGGALADAAYARSRSGRLYVLLVAVAINAAAAGIYFTTERGDVALIASFFMMAGLAMSNGPALTTVNDLAPRHLRATASALTFAATYLIGNSLGPYGIGELSDFLAKAGQSEGQALGHAALLSLAMLPLAYALIAYSIYCFDVKLEDAPAPGS